MAEPTWGKGDAFGSFNAAVAAYKEALKAIATGLARRENADRVLLRHVQDAERIIEAAGKSRRRWYERHEFEISLGGAVLGCVPSTPEFLSACILAASSKADANLVAMLSSAGTLAVLLAGILFMTHGWLRAIGIFGAITAPPAKPAVSRRAVQLEAAQVESLPESQHEDRSAETLPETA